MFVRFAAPLLAPALALLVAIPAPAPAAEKDGDHGVGKPFKLEFKDVATGKTIRTADMKGKVVVVEFWATWCPPCVAETPYMKKAYARYKDKGVEFIGVSLDQPEKSDGGLTKLKKFIAKHEIEWPQYYEGEGWDGEFSNSWDITAIPRVFVVDQDGNLHTRKGRGNLDDVLPELLSKRPKSADDRDD